MPNRQPILAILVLYRMSFEDSPTYQTLQRAFRDVPGATQAIDLVVADNSPLPQPPPASFSGRYLHDGTNPGLANRYNYALGLAQGEGRPWLLTLDQDTQLTSEYLKELLELATSISSDEAIGIVLPKLVMGGRIYSPHPPKYQRRASAIGLRQKGVVSGLLHGFNSAALVRVSALKAIGGYPERYWLDFLDHATFTGLQRAGGQVYLMEAVLEHDLSAAKPHNIQHVRRDNMCEAESRFYRDYGTAGERVLHKVDLLRQVVGHFRRGRIRTAMFHFKYLLGWR